MGDAIVLQTRTLEETMAVGAAVGALCVAGDLVALSGELGAGKTQFVRGMARGLGLDPRQVSSPTFVIAQEYEPADEEGAVLVHIDAYRLTSGEELATLGWAGEGGDLPEGAVLAVEWAERVDDVLPADRLDVRLEHEAGGRRITVEPRGAWGARMMGLRQALRNAAAHHHE